MENLDFRSYKSLDVTGVTTSGERFTYRYANDYGGRMIVFSINLWRGTIWGVLPNGKRKQLKKVWN